jgi:hypothetical protein
VCIIVMAATLRTLPLGCDTCRMEIVHKAEASPDRPLPVCFLSDYGRVDEFVAVVHGVLMQLAPGVAILDITHDVPPRDVRAGALALLRAVQYLPESVGPRSAEPLSAQRIREWRH